MLDRLALSDKAIETMALGLEQIGITRPHRRDFQI